MIFSKNLSKKSQLFFIFLIIILAAILRLYNLSENPKGFFADEASVGYNAYSILKTGRDEHGNFLPFFFKAFGDYKNPILIYSIVPSVALLGLSEFSVRVIPATYGILTVIILFFLTKKLFDFKTAIISSFFLAISPWHVHLSRVALEGLAPFVFFLTLSTYLFLVGQNKNWVLFLSFFFFGLTLYTYFPTRLFTPLLLLILLLLHPKLLKKRQPLIISLLILGIVTLPLISHLFSGEGFERWKQVAIFSSNFSIGELFSKIARSYLNHFSLDFLFRFGDSQFPNQFITRHSVIGIGELYWFQLPLLLFGIFYFLRSGFKRETKILFFWLLLYPLGTIFTNAPGPQATRSFVGVIPFQIISAIGFWQIWELLKVVSKRRFFSWINLVFGFSLFLIVFLSFISFLSLHQNYPLYSSDYWGWQYGPQEIVKYFTQVENQYDELIMSNRFNAPEIFLKFYAPNNCQKCKIGNTTLFNFNKKQLFALSPGELPAKDYKVQKEIYYPNGQIAFKIIKVQHD